MRTLGPYDPANTYAAVLDALPIIAYIADPAGEVTYLSRGWERFTGNRAADVLRDGYTTVIHPDDVPLVAQTWDSARESGTAYRDDFRLRSGDSYRWVMSQADPMRDPSGAIVGWFGTITDIHDLRSAEEGLSRALAAAFASARDAADRAEFVERLLDASDDCVKVLDLDARLISMSANGQRALAIMDFATIEGADWLGFWSDSDRVAAERAVQAARDGGRGRFTGLFVVNGVDKWWDVTVTPILGPSERPERLLAVSRDITEMLLAHRALERSEERYRVLGEALPGVTWSATPDGHLDYVSGSKPLMTGEPGVGLGDSWLDLLHPDDRERASERWLASVKNGMPYETQFRMQAADGSYRWQLVRALPQCDDSGVILRWVGVNVDIDEQRQADDAREQFVRLVENSDDFISIADMEGAVTYVNEAGRQMLGIGTPSDARATRLMDYFSPEDRAFVVEEIMPAVERSGRWIGEFRLKHFQTDEPIPIWYNVFRLLTDAGSPAGIATVSRDVRQRQRVEAGLRTLAETGALMFRSLDFEQTVRNVVEAITDEFATYAIIDMLDEHGRLRHLASAHRDPAYAPTLTRAVTARRLQAGHHVMRAVREAASTFVSHVGPNWTMDAGMEPASRADVEALAARSLLCVPLRDGTAVIGALTFVVDVRDPRGAYSSDDLRFAEEIALRAGLAFEHARAFEHERRIAVTLQEASLPKTLPAVDHLYLSADYRPGNSEATIGGDWYDAFALDDGRIAVTIGDVLGNGLSAAVTMGKVRQAMQAAALVRPDPNVMLDVADSTVRAVSGETYATAIAGIFDSRTHEYTFASAGHPGPILRSPDGRIEELSSTGLLLGLRERGETETIIVATPPGSTLIFYTDGLIEATRNFEDGHRRLHRAIADDAVACADNPARAIVEHVLGGDPASDDIAVLVVEIGPHRRR